MNAAQVRYAPLLCEQEELQEFTGKTLRPGGLELTRRAMDFCKLPAASTILDVGCGYGQTMSFLAAELSLSPTGLDPLPSMLWKTAHTSPGAPLLLAEADAIPVQNDFFDAIISECVLSLTGKMQASLQEMWRVLAPGGKLVLTDIYVHEEQSRPSVHPTAIRSCLHGAVSLQTLENYLRDAGFTIQLLEDHTDLLRQLAGQIIFTYGSLSAFWQLFMGTDEAECTCCSLELAKPGYYLLVAAKE